MVECCRLVRSVLNTAGEDDELIRRNPYRIKGAGAEMSGERPVATPAQVLALVEAMPERWRALALLAVAASLWWGELMGLTRVDVDLRAPTLRVSGQSDVRGRIVVGPPKSTASPRMVTVPASVVPMVREHLATFSEKGPNGRVFVGSKGATIRRTNFQVTWSSAVKVAGLPAGFRFHDLRVRHEAPCIPGGVKGPAVGLSQQTG